MRKSYFFLLILALAILFSCTDSIVFSEKYDEPKVNNYQDRLNVINAEKENQNDPYSRWNTPWWSMESKELADSISASNNEALISFKEPEKLAGVQNGIVQVSEETVKNGIEFLRNTGIKILKVYDKTPYILAELSPTKKLIDILRENLIIDVVEPNIRGEYLSSGYNWNIELINASEPWDYSTGNGVDIMIIDSGINEEHQYFDVTILEEVCAENNTNPFNRDHASQVAGIIGGKNTNTNFYGVAYNSNLYSCQAGDSQPEAAVVISGIEYARAAHIKIINLSIGFNDESSALKDQIAGAYYQDNVLMVAAAGNSGSSGSLGYFAKLEEIMAITAVDENNDPYTDNSTGPEIELTAPGVSVRSTCYDDECFSTGTSFAAPHVSAAAALLKSYKPSLSNKDIRSILNNSAKTLSEPSDVVGNGLLDAKSAFNYVIPLDAVINGDNYLDSGQQGTWIAEPEYGTHEYSYQWYYRESTSDPWTTAGNDSDTFHWTFNNSSSSIENRYIRVTVTSGNEETTEMKSVTVHSDQCEPNEILC